MNKNIFGTLIALLIVFQNSCAPKAVSAEVALSEPTQGMSYSALLQIWGPALNKIEYESKREERWNFGERYALFKNGSLLDWSGRILMDKESSDPKSTSSANFKEDGELDVNSILNDILDSKSEYHESTGSPTEPSAPPDRELQMLERIAEIRASVPPLTPEQEAQRAKELAERMKVKDAARVERAESRRKLEERIQGVQVSGVQP